MPLVSIVTINLNNKDGLKSTIDSVRYQSFKDYEYIVIDGASTDDSKVCIQENQDIITFWSAEPDRGIYHAMNKGIMAAKGKYLLFLNSGDFFENSNVLSNISGYLQEDTDIIYGNINRIQTDGKVRILKYPARISSYYMKVKFISHQSTFTKRQTLLDLHLYDESYTIAADTAFLIKAIFSHRATYRYINVTIARYNTEGISSQKKYKDAVYNERDRALKSTFSPAKYYGLVILTPVLRVYWGIYKFLWLS
jgi:glycosyltransferase involved in cell wall biosynthesis